MKLSEIVAGLNELKATVAGFIGDKAKATTEALSAFSAKISTLETGAVTELGQKTADLLTAQATIGTLTAGLEKAQNEVNAIGLALKSACSAFKLDIKEGATSADMVSALQGSVTSTLAKINVPISTIPAPAPAANGGVPKTELKGRARMLVGMKIEGITPRN